MKDWIQRVRGQAEEAESVDEILRRCRVGGNNLVVSAMRGGSPALVSALLAQKCERPSVIVVSTLERAEALSDGMALFGSPALLLPPFETLPFEETEPAMHISAARSVALAEWAKADVRNIPAPLVIPADALMTRILPRAEIIRRSLVIEWGERYDIDALAAKLVEIGYRREAMVESPGEFSVRGTILDLYPAEAELPYRLDFFGNEIESIRSFDVATQRSVPLTKDLERIRILPRTQIAPSLEFLASGGSLATVFDLLPDSTLVMVDGPTRVAQRFEYFDEIVKRHWDETSTRAKGDHPGFFNEHKIQPEAWTLSSAEAKQSLAQFQRVDWIDLAAEGDDAARTEQAASIVVGAQSFETIQPNFNNYVELLDEKRHMGYRVGVVCDNAGQMQRLDELLAERQIPAVKLESEGGTTISLRDVALMVGDLHEGFIFPAAKILLVTDREMFGRYKKRRVHRRAYSGKSFKDPTEIQRGDYVVHADHGIGQFEGIRRQAVEGITLEFLEIVYQDGDKLLVPVDKLHLVQKYASAEGKTPAMDKLGKKAWGRRTAKSREMIRKLAGELLELYARREAAQGFAFGPDTVWQREFEAAFLYQETPDQLKAIHEVKSDMSLSKPMDRLVCGDVGYGKTEVAIRAAFKALAENKQVAVLAPTTLLVQQHYNTFRERLADFPFRVAMLSRFVSPAEQKAALADLAIGKVNLVVGTHRLLSRDVKFRDLGLLVVDEEQRFGVAQKEKIKSLKTSVDIVTLTATPIPRTLHMALAKLRDLSLIQTPPADRLPIKTRTIYFDKDPIEEAILRELNRGGQVFFVHNRIESIEEVADSIRQIVPQARLAIAHGQMDEDTLEQIMADFIGGKFDVLLSTTIIENGIDIPNVNTIIINRADAFGLAQLYQLRGRVGRDVRQAYAYLILPRGKPITDTAVKRLSALEEFTELGMGFSVAMRDMEIRGTGNLLGAEQHGAITDIGFEMYCRLLEEAVMELRGEPPPDPPHPTEIKWPADQWLPEEFIPVEAQRIRFYKELAGARDADQLELAREEMLDRYGSIPQEATNLINAFRIKLALAAWKVDTVRQGAAESIRIIARESLEPLERAFAKLAKEEAWIDRIERRADGNIIIHLYDPEMKPDDVLAALAELCSQLPSPDRVIQNQD